MSGAAFSRDTNWLVRGGPALDDLAAELGVSASAITKARLDPDADGYRRPPEVYRAALVRLAKRRIAELEGVVRKLEGEMTTLERLEDELPRCRSDRSNDVIV